MTRGHKVCSIKMQSPRHVGVAKCSKSSKQTLARWVHKLPSRKEIVVSSPSHISTSPARPGPPLARIARQKCSWEKLHSLRQQPPPPLALTKLSISFILYFGNFMLRHHIYYNRSRTHSCTRIRWQNANQLSSGIEVRVRVMQMKQSSFGCEDL